VTMNRRDLLRVGMLPLAGAAAACNPVDLISSPPQLYTLTPKSTFSPEVPRVDWQLLVETPSAPAAIDTARIVLMRTGMMVDYFANVAWIDRAPLMVQTLLLESFENSGRIIAVGRESVALRADFVLRTELREFQAEFAPDDPRPFAVVRIIARLVAMPRRSIEATQSFEARTQASAADFPALMEAFDASLGAVLKRVVEWTLRTGNGIPRR